MPAAEVLDRGWAARQSQWLLAALIFGGIGLVAYTDWRVASVSIAYLYILPLALSAFVYPLPVSVGLALVCVALADWFGPHGHAGGSHVARYVLTATQYVFAVVVLHGLVRQRLRLTGVVASQRDLLARDLRRAAELQKSLLPATPPPLEDFELAVRMYPARIVGGDIYDFLPLGEGVWAVTVGDVSGKGVAAGLLMSAVVTAIRIEAAHGRDPVAMLGELNEELYRSVGDGKYVSLFVAVLAAGRPEILYVNAGHPPALLCRAEGGEAIWLERGGPVVGLLPGARFEAAEVSVGGGDVLVLYTDGLVEAENAEGEQFGAARLAAVVAANRDKAAPRLLRAIAAAVLRFRGGAEPEDDTTLIVLKRRRGRPRPTRGGAGERGES